MQPRLSYLNAGMTSAGLKVSLNKIQEMATLWCNGICHPSSMQPFVESLCILPLSCPCVMSTRLRPAALTGLRLGTVLRPSPGKMLGNSTPQRERRQRAEQLPGGSARDLRQCKVCERSVGFCGAGGGRWVHLTDNHNPWLHNCWWDGVHLDSDTRFCTFEQKKTCWKQVGGAISARHEEWRRKCASHRSAGKADEQFACRQRPEHRKSAHFSIYVFSSGQIMQMIFWPHTARIISFLWQTELFRGILTMIQKKSAAVIV